MDLGESPCPPTSTHGPRPFSRMRKKRHRPAPPQTQPTVFSVRANPSHYLSSFSPGAISPEQRAVTLLLERSLRSVCLVGLPGTGKTVALRAVAHHAAIHATFRDAVALLGLADATTADSLLSDLCELVGRIAGARPRADIEHALAANRSHMGAVDAVAAALRDRRVLLLLDNVCDTHLSAPVLQLVLRLVSAATTGTARLAVLASARGHRVARLLAPDGLVPVSLLDPTGPTARAIMAAHLGVDRDEFERSCKVEGNSIVPVLQRCGGLPLALAVAGGAVKRLLVGSGSRDTIWGHYRSYLYGNFEQFGDISRLFANLSACVDDVQNWPLGMPVRHALAELRDIQSGSWIPWTVLQKLWHVPKRSGVTDAIDSLARQCLVAKECDKNNEVGMTVPAIVLDYCKHEAKLLAQSREKSKVVDEVTKTGYIPPHAASTKPPAAPAVGISSNGGGLQKQGNGLRKGSAGIRKPSSAGRTSEVLKAVGHNPQSKRRGATAAVDPLMLHFTGAVTQQYQAAQGEKES